MQPPPSSLPAAPDFLDHHTVVQFALAMPHAGFEYIGVNFEQRKRLLCASRLFEHQLNVFEMLANAAFSREVGVHHLGALDVHHLRVACRTACDLEKSIGIKSEPFGEDKTLRERQAIEPEDEIDRELCPSTIADLAEVEIAGKQRAQNWLRPGNHLCFAANKPDTLATAHLTA